MSQKQSRQTRRLKPKKDTESDVANSVKKERELEMEAAMAQPQFDKKVNQVVSMANQQYIDNTDANSDLQGLMLEPEMPKIPAGQEMNKKQLYLAKPPNNRIVLCYGPIPNRKPTVFFNYPPFLKLQRPYDADRIRIIS